MRSAKGRVLTSSSRAATVWNTGGAVAVSRPARQEPHAVVGVHVGDRLGTRSLNRGEYVFSGGDFEAAPAATRHN